MMKFHRPWLFIALAVFLMPALSACSSRDKETFSEHKWAGQVEETRLEDLHALHHGDDGFFSPWMEMPGKSFLDVLGWKLFSKTAYTEPEKTFLPRVIPGTAERLARTRGDFILWIGHNTFLIRIDGTWWMTDPIFSKRALVAPRQTPPALTLVPENQPGKEPLPLGLLAACHPVGDPLFRGRLGIFQGVQGIPTEISCH